VLINVRVLLTAWLSQKVFAMGAAAAAAAAVNAKTSGDGGGGGGGGGGDGTMPRLVGRQWVALGVLLVACAVGATAGATTATTAATAATGAAAAAAAANALPSSSSSSSWLALSLARVDAVGLAFLLAQAACSSVAGVYFQWLLQGQARSLGLWPKSVFLYGWGVALNVAVAAAVEPAVLGLGGAGAGAGAGGGGGAFRGFDATLWFIIAMGSVGGLVTGLLLRHLDAIMKVRPLARHG
jgi:hypothetical protein